MNESAFNVGSETAHLVLSAKDSVLSASNVAVKHTVSAASTASEALVSFFAGFKAGLAVRSTEC
jgi:hypothetical protein